MPPTEISGLGRTIAALLLATAVLVGCSDDAPDTTSPTGSAADGTLEFGAPLPASWTADPGTVDSPPVAIGDAVVVRSDTAYTAFDTASGEQRWRHPVDGGVCAASTAPGDVAAYVSGRRCTTLTTVDLTTGRALWERTIPQQDQGGVTLKVETGDRTVTLRGSCDQILRYSLEDGRGLGVLAPVDVVCGNETDTDGQLIAIWHDPEATDTPDDQGTGWIPPYDDTAALEVWDADTGRLLWRREQTRRGGGLGQLVSSAPLVLDTISGGQELMRLFDERTGRPGPHVGLRGSGRATFVEHGATDGVLVGTYGGSTYGHSTTVAYDLTDGAEVWRRRAPDPRYPDQVLGVDDDGVLLGTVRTGVHDDESVRGLWLTRLDLDDGESRGVVGWVPDAGAGAWPVGDLVVVAGEDGITAYEPPEPDPDTEVPDAPAVDMDWADDDVRELPDLTPCQITRETLELMGFRTTDLPPPSSCSWHEDYQPDGVDRWLDATIDVAAPLAEQSASDMAAEQVDTWVQNASDPVEVAGLGDEAWVANNSLPDRSRVDAGLAVRVGNVVVTVDAGVEAFLPTHRAATAPPYAVERAAVRAAQELFAVAGIDLTVPDPGADGAVIRVGSACGLAADEAAVLVPGARPVDLSPDRGTDPDHRVSSCGWSSGDYQPELFVHVLSVPGSPLTGRDAVRTAHRLVRSPASGSVVVPHVGDRALLDSFTFEKGRSRTETVTAVRDNVVVVVEYSLWEQYAAEDKERMDAAAIRVARDVLAAHR